MMRQGPELAAIGNRLASRVDGKQAAAAKGPDVRAPVFVERKIPSRDRAATVAQNTGERAAPLCPVSSIVRSGIVRSAFCPVHSNFREFLLNSINPLRLTQVAMPSHSVSVFADIGNLKLGNSPAP